MEDLKQFRASKRHAGRKATNKQLDIDFKRKHFGNKQSKDAFLHRSIFPISESLVGGKEGLIESFIDDIEDLKLTQRVVAIFIYCGFTLQQIKNILKLKHDPDVYKMLRGEMFLWQMSRKIHE